MHQMKLVPGLGRIKVCTLYMKGQKSLVVLQLSTSVLCQLKAQVKKNESLLERVRLDQQEREVGFCCQFHVSQLERGPGVANLKLQEFQVRDFETTRVLRLQLHLGIVGIAAMPNFAADSDLKKASLSERPWDRRGVLLHWLVEEII